MGHSLRVKVDIEADSAEKPEQAYVEGWIKGTDLTTSRSSSPRTSRRR